LTTFKKLSNLTLDTEGGKLKIEKDLNMLDITFENVLEFIIIDIFGNIFKFMSKVVSLIVIEVKYKGKKSVKEVWQDKDGSNFSSLNDLTQMLTIFFSCILTLALLISFILFIVILTYSLIKTP
jgi:hypothetical protein